MTNLVQPSTESCIIGQSKAIKCLTERIREAAPWDATVLIQGPSGVGKELVANAIHQNSPRPRGPFLAINCTSLSDNLLESELFGHEKGAFTGAVGRRTGLFERAHGGTLFLDEIGEVSPMFQAKLLRVLQEREFERVGGTEIIKVDVRIIAATNKDLHQGVAQGWFRPDLFYRLNVIPVTVPPLNVRKVDIPLLADHFLAAIARKNGRQTLKMTDRCIQTLMAYDYPGNVRELQNIIQWAAVRAKSSLIRCRDLPPDLLKSITIGAGQEAANLTAIPLEALKKINIQSPKGKPHFWHQSLRDNAIEEIHRYLQGTHGNWFCRRDFADYLESCSKRNRNKYKTAGVYLHILAANGIVEHNDKKANNSRYRLSGRFANQTAMCLIDMTCPNTESDPSSCLQEEQKPSAPGSPVSGSIWPEKYSA